MKSIEWAAGLFEGEGSICKLKDGRTRLFLEMTDKDVVESFRDVLDTGSVTGPHYRADYKPVYKWNIGKQKVVKKILEAMLPLLGERRSFKALNCLDDIDNYLFLKAT